MTMRSKFTAADVYADMAERTSYPYGYKPIQPKSASVTLPELERQKAQARRNNLRNQKSYKVLLIGESGVGKSTLVARLCEDRFLAESRQHTLGKLGVVCLKTPLLHTDLHFPFPLENLCHILTPMSEAAPSS